ncbi:CGNR zinc finger domain-containing protein, partial [Actinomadura roseirufa]|uniref:CGNR zinc finger domain-containing protein n=1 Tax=Actinomadura roseirufa TaxID=2094049 RepID=UPI0013F1530F
PRCPRLVLRAERSEPAAWPLDGARVLVSTPAPAADAALALVARSAITIFGGPSRTAVRACGGPGCVLFFVKNHPRREWCSPGCGNRARVGRHYQRHRDPS